MKRVVRASSLITTSIILISVAGWLAKPVLRAQKLGYEGRRILEEIRQSPLPWKVLGASGEGRDIRALECNEAGPGTVLVLGAVHGDEPLGARLTARLATFVHQDLECRSGYHVLIVPVVNPDGLVRGTRVNANGVDLNRNFPSKNWSPESRKERYYPGTAPDSEPETRLLTAMIEDYDPMLIVSVHAPLHAVNFDGPAGELAAAMAQRNGYPVKADLGYPTPGSLGSYAGADRDIPTVTLELPPSRLDEIWEDNREALLYVLRFEPPTDHEKGKSS